MRIKPWWLPRWLKRGLRDVSISERGVLWFGGDRPQSSLPLQQIAGARTRHGLIWTEIVIEDRLDAAGERSIRTQDLRFAGFRAAQASKFVAVVSSLAAGARLDELAGVIDAALQSWDRPHGRDQFMTQPLHQEWQREHSSLCAKVQDLLKRDPPESEVRRRSAQVLETWSGGEWARSERNARWMSGQREKHAGLFAGAMGYPLNEEQIAAILHDEHRCLVVAGAGTGKTTTVVAKTKWILAQRLASHDRIRILAFNKKAANEVATRLRAETGTDSVASTFHSLGLSIVAEGRGRKPQLTRLGEDPRLMQRFIRSCLDDALDSPAAFEKVANFLFFFRYPEPNPVPAVDSHEAHRFAEGHAIRTLTGVRVRSNSEAAIGNWLTLNGIEWEYEPKYPLDTVTMKHGQYRPDFLLPESKIYIEHWSCNQDGHLPSTWSEVEKQNYLDGMTWKRALHERCGTRLVETYSSPLIWRDVIQRLEHELLQLEVTPIPLSAEARRALLVEDAIISPAVTLAARFLSLFRESGLTLSDIYSEAGRRTDERGKAFINMLDVIHTQYADHLHDEEAIDFSDMIRDAALLVREGRVDLPLDYLIVDEFQDISRGRAELIKAILSRNEHCRLVAVGDDWQSIYRFAGSDIRLMLDFESEFGATTRSDLKKTQRFGDKLLEATSRFIQTNPRQLKKKLVAARKDELPAIEILSLTSAAPEPLTSGWTTSLGGSAMLVHDRGDEDEGGYYRAQTSSSANEQSTAAMLEELLRRISVDRKEASVLVLSRYSFLLRDIQGQIEIPSNVRLSLSTVHRAKGLEADFVVILSVVMGPFGFPTAIEDDPIMELLLPDTADFQHAEERRLLYVAMTRARSKAFVITRHETRSVFVEELASAVYDGLVIGSDTSSHVVNCPECGGGALVLRESRYGPYFRCAHELCRGKALRCPRCRGGGLLRGPERHECVFCSYTVENCPNCTRGYLKHVPGGVSRDSGRAYDAFDACSTNRREPAYRCFIRACTCS